jgi:HD-GYP domain-containing protein (c-di-GMP phosphodiesterase class II)
LASPNRAVAQYRSPVTCSTWQLGVPPEVTAKPAVLSVEEMELMHRHPSFRARILEHAPRMKDIAAWVEAHHERPDGRG